MTDGRTVVVWIVLGVPLVLVGMALFVLAPLGAPLTTRAGIAGAALTLAGAPLFAVGVVGADPGSLWSRSRGAPLRLLGLVLLLAGLAVLCV